MPRFYFHLHECGTIIDDPEGSELADVDAARDKAVAEARQVMSSEVLEGRLCLGCCIIVEDGGHHELLRIPFREAIALTGIRPD